MNFSISGNFSLWRKMPPQLPKAMKLTAIFLLAFFLQLSAKSVSQVTLSLKDASAEKVFREIERQTGIGFLYTKRMVSHLPRVTIEVKNAPVSEVLDRCFLGQPLEYTFDKNTIVITRKKTVIPMPTAVNSIIAIPSPPQIEIRGRVTDESGNPLAGVSVTLKSNPAIGTTTNEQGEYSLSSENTNGALVFSSVGYTTQEIPINGRTTVDAVLQSSTSSLEDVVVVGYGTQKKSSVTGAISQMKSEDMMDRTVSNVQQALQGKVAGVNINQGSGAPGSSPAVNIRGIGSTSGSTPLYIVDGRIAENGIDNIDPNNVESIEVLKDAASAAIYGIAAGNGVILVTTKKGQIGEGKISYDFQISQQNIAKIPKVMNSQQYIEWMTSANYLEMDQIQRYWDSHTNTNWAKEVFTNSLMARHNLSLSGGNQKGRYYFGLSYLNNDGYVIGNNDTYKRATATINANYNIKKWLEIGTNNQIEYNTRRSIAEGSEYGSLLMTTLQLDPLTPVTYPADKLPDFMQKALDENHKLYQDNQGDYYSLSPYQISDQYNPFIMRDKSQNSIAKGYGLNGSFFANLKPLKEIVITSRFNYGLNGLKDYNFNQRFYANASVNQLYNEVVATSNNPINYQWENFANFTKDFRKHNLNLMVGTSIRQSFSYGVTGTIQGKDEIDLGIIDDPLFAFPAYAGPTTVKTVEGGEETRISWLSYFGRVTYDFDNKYFLQASVRRDGADLSTLPLKKRWGTFPAVSVGWAISDESFFQGIRKTMSFLKLRASWGQNGTSSMLAGSWMWNNVIAYNDVYPFTNDLNYTDAYSPNVLGNPFLGWERQEQLDFGFDAQFLNNRLTLAFDYFEKKSKDLIMNDVTLSNIVGNSSSPINAGSMINHGLEFEAAWTDNINENFRWGIKANIATINNKVQSVHESLTRINGAQVHTNVGVTVFEPGYPAWYIRGYQVEGIDHETGDPIFKDLDHNDILNDNDKALIGKPLPDFNYGVTLSASWKGLDFIAFGTGAHGNDILMAINRGDRLQANTLLLFYNERWTPDNHNATMARNNAANLDKYWLSDAFIWKGSFFKIKQIQLGYSISQRILDKLKIDRIRIYGSLDDFFTFTKYPGFDPETVGSGNSTGLDKGNYPLSRKVVFGLNVTL